jgi:hypothetical protein
VEEYIPFYIPVEEYIPADDFEGGIFRTEGWSVFYLNLIWDLLGILIILL